MPRFVDDLHVAGAVTASAATDEVTHKVQAAPGQTQDIEQMVAGDGVTVLVRTDVAGNHVAQLHVPGSGPAYSRVGHSHGEADVTSLLADLAGKAAASHAHAEGDVTSLLADLAGKAAASHAHAEGDVTSLVADLAGKAAASHSHVEGDVTSLVTDLAAKIPKSIGTTKGDLAVFDGTNWVRVGVGTNNQVLTADSAQAAGAKWATPAAGSARLVPIALSTADVLNASSTAFNDLGSLTIPAGDAAAGDIYRYVAYGDTLNNSGSGATFTFKFRWGATTFQTLATGSLTSGANGAKWKFEVEIFVVSTTVQRIGMFVSLSQQSANPIPGNTNLNGAGYGTATEDLTAALTCSAQGQVSVSHANAQFNGRAAQLYRIR